jgi:hypothetical protein
MPRSSALAPSVAHRAFASDHIVAVFTVALALAAAAAAAPPLLPVLLAAVVAVAVEALLLPPFTCKRVRMTSRGFVSNTCNRCDHITQKQTDCVCVSLWS